MNYFLSLVVLSTFCCAVDLHLEKFESLSAHYKPGAAVERIVNSHSHEPIRPATYSYNPAVNRVDKKLATGAWNRGYMFPLTKHYIIDENADCAIRFNDQGDLISFSDGYHGALVIGDYPKWYHDIREITSRTDRPVVITFMSGNVWPEVLVPFIEAGQVSAGGPICESDDALDCISCVVSYIDAIRSTGDFGLTYVAINYKNPSAIDSVVSHIASFIYSGSVVNDLPYSTNDDRLVLTEVIAYIAEKLHRSGYTCTIDKIIAYLKRCGVTIDENEIDYSLIERYIASL